MFTGIDFQYLLTLIKQVISDVCAYLNYQNDI